MFGLFKNKPFQPLDYDTRKWYENNFLWLVQEFDNPKHENRKIFSPTKTDFPIDFDSSEKSATDALDIILEQLQIKKSEIQLDFFEPTLKEINLGTSTIYLEDDKENPNPAGLYYNKSKKNGTYSILLDRALLSKPNNLISTMVHELCHVKLLGEKRIEFNDEHLTDLATICFGFGVFNANSSFQFYKKTDSWGYSSLGYMQPPEWSYALALSSFYRNEDNPEWSTYLNSSLKKDFDDSLKYMQDNEMEIFRIDEEK